MGIVQVEQNRLKQLEIEVKALAALIAHGNHYYKTQAQRRLFEIAMPDLLAEQLEQEQL
tara:strand:+ start:1584 stop:1760 length:177 start_codon:yes stop_codon:yes gene_type:complete